MQDKIVLVTGGTKRIGRAICRKLHSEGMGLMVHYRTSEKEAQSLQKELNQIRPDSVAIIQADLLDINQFSILVNETIKSFGRIDSLVNNASSFYPSPIGKITGESWNELIGCNLKAPLFISQAAAPHIKKNNGSIINIIDIHSEWPLKEYIIYSLAKGGLATLTKSLAIELAPEVRVNGISPGPILWPENGAWSDQITRQKIINKTLLKRTGEPDDIAKAVFFLISEASYITGQILAVDGGQSINL